MWKQVNSWNSRFLSKAGREVIIKFIAQTIPAYCMNIVQIPITILNELHRMLNVYWWSGKREGRHDINQLAWEKMCGSKKDRVMGF